MRFSAIACILLSDVLHNLPTVIGIHAFSCQSRQFHALSHNTVLSVPCPVNVFDRMEGFMVLSTKTVYWGVPLCGLVD
jgi:hypothetical protein